MESEVDSLATIIESGTLKEKRDAVSRLKECQDKSKAFDLLISCLINESFYIRGDAAFEISSFTEFQGAVLPLIEALADEEIWVLRNAVITIGYFKDERAVEPLILLLNHQDGTVNNSARNSLVKIGGRRVIEFALKDLESEQPSQDSILILGDLREKNATKLLIQRLEQMCWASAYSLGKIGGDVAAKALERSLHNVLIYGSTSGYKVSLIKALTRLEYEESIETIIKAMKVKNEDVRVWAAYALGKIGGERSEEILLRTKKDKSQRVRDAAIRAIDGEFPYLG
jgi:HEAT repeat protein